MAAALTLALAACGGGGGSSTPATPVPPDTPATPSIPVGGVTMSLAPASILTSQSATLSWSAANARDCVATGAWSGSQAASGSTSVTQAQTGSYTYGLTCTTDSGSVSGSATLTVTNPTNNVAALTLDDGPQGSSYNVPFVSVTICQPGTSVCKTIDHIMVDTGSYGLRLINQGVLNDSLPLPAVTAANGAPLAECAQFVSGYTWGSVRRADVKVAGETARNIPIEIIGDSGSAYATVPSGCSSAGANVGSVATMGANGILGVGFFKQDCGTYCAQASDAGFYYGCPSGGCTPVTVPLANQVSNPVHDFAYNNNGLQIILPAVSAGGASSITGSMIFGVNTQPNNQLGAAAVYKANSSGNFTTTYKGKALTGSFIDSGSNGIYFPDSTLATCGGGFYCSGSAPLNLSATNASFDGSNSGVVDFFLDDPRYLPGDNHIAHIGGNPGIASFDWGLPFFLGRTVSVVFQGQATSKGTGPFWAY